MRMPFGQYKGKRVSELPDAYLTWLWEHFPLHPGPLQEAIAQEVEVRFHALKQVMRDMIERGFRQLAQERSGGEGLFPDPHSILRLRRAYTLLMEHVEEAGKVPPMGGGLLLLQHAEGEHSSLT